MSDFNDLRYIKKIFKNDEQLSFFLQKCPLPITLLNCHDITL